MNNIPTAEQPTTSPVTPTTKTLKAGRNSPKTRTNTLHNKKKKQRDEKKE